MFIKSVLLSEIDFVELYVLDALGHLNSKIIDQKSLRFWNYVSKKLLQQNHYRLHRSGSETLNEPIPINKKDLRKQIIVTNKRTTTKSHK